MSDEIRIGGCGCGALRYELSGAPLFVHACHCHDCQRRSGSAFGMTMLIEETQLRLTRGEPASALFPTDAGNSKTAYFCAACGMHIWNHNSRRPQVLGFRPGTLDDTSWVRLQAHIWVKRKQPWLSLDDDLPAFEEYYDFRDVWPVESIARLAAMKR